MSAPPSDEHNMEAAAWHADPNENVREEEGREEGLPSWPSREEVPSAPVPPLSHAQTLSEEHAENGGNPTGDANAHSRRAIDDATRQQLFMEHKVRNWMFLCLLGIINNFHYNLVISAADGLATGYGMKKYVALISFCNVFFGIIARILNAFVANRVSYNLRMTIMCCGTLTGVLLVSFSGPLGFGSDGLSFFVVLLGVTCSGTSYSYGEAVALAYLQRYPPTMVGAWSCGTGVSGVVASVLYILLTTIGVSKPVIFLMSTPLTVVYWLTFTVGLLAPHKMVVATYTDGRVPATKEVVLHRGEEEKTMQKVIDEAGGPQAVTMSEYSIKMFFNLKGLSWGSVPIPPTSGKLAKYMETEESKKGKGGAAYVDVDAGGAEPELSDPEEGDNLHYPVCRVFCFCVPTQASIRRWWVKHGATIKLIHSNMFYFFYNLAAVYISEYMVQFMAPFAFYCEDEWMSNFFVKNSYTITQFCYQFGVFLSRSSLPFVKITFVGVLSILQCINAVCWFIQAKTLLISSKSSEHAEVGMSFILFVWMLYVGLLGGSSYVNVFFLVLSRTREMEGEARLVLDANFYKEKEMQALGGGNGSSGNSPKVSKPGEVFGRPTADDRSDEEDSEEDRQRRSMNGSMTDMAELAELHHELAEEWQRRRELGMSVGSLYAMIGISIGTCFDVLFTNTILTHQHTCKA